MSQVMFSGAVRRVVLAAAVVGMGSAVVPFAGAPAAHGAHGRGAGDHLTVTVRDAGAEVDGTYEVRCGASYALRASGRHPDPSGACRAVRRNSRAGADAFAPVPGGTVCTMQYGGPATAHVTGTWGGRAVDATFDRSDGCEIGRWDRLVPLLPDLGR